MSLRTRLFLAIVLAAGAGAAVYAAATWTSSPINLFATLFLFCVGTSLLRVVLPGIPGTLSLNYVFLVWGVARLGFGETVLMGIVSALVQSYWQCQKRPKPAQVAFNVALIALSVSACKLAFSSKFTQVLAPSEPIRILVSSVVYFLINTSCVAAIISLTEARPIGRVWRGSYMWTLPHYLLGASIVVATEALIRAVGIQIVLLVIPVLYLVYHTFQMHITGLNQAVERAEVERRHAEATADLHLQTIRALALAIEAKDRTTGEHLHRVQTYALELAKDFGLPAAEVEALRAAAILHDIGKIAVPEHIISKPAKLTPEEFSKMKIHPVVGAEIIESVKFPFPVAPLVRAHHEKWDGTGYPDGLKGEGIPLGARILTAVDCLDALASDRQYRKAIPLDKAMAMVQAESGKSFDPRVVELLSKRYRELEQLARATIAGANIELSTELKVHRGKAPDAGFGKGWDEADRPPHESTVLEWAVIQEIHQEISQMKPLEDTLPAIQVSLRKLIPFDCLALFVKNDESVACLYAKGRNAELLSNLKIALGIGVSGWVAANGKPLLNGNAVTEFGVSGSVPPGFDLQSGLAVALDSALGPAAVITLYSREREAFRMNHLRALRAIESWLAYHLWLNFSTAAAAAVEAVAPHNATTPAQLLRLSRYASSGLVEERAIPA